MINSGASSFGGGEEERGWTPLMMLFERHGAFPEGNAAAEAAGLALLEAGADPACVSVGGTRSDEEEEEKKEEEGKLSPLYHSIARKMGALAVGLVVRSARSDLRSNNSKGNLAIVAAPAHLASPSLAGADAGDAAIAAAPTKDGDGAELVCGARARLCVTPDAGLRLRIEL